MHTRAVKGYGRNRRKRTTDRRSYSHSCSMQSSTEFQKLVRNLVSEEKEFEIKLQNAREFVRLKKEQREKRTLATKSKQQSVTSTQEASQKSIPRAHMQKRSEEWIAEPSKSNSNHPYKKRYSDMVSGNKLSDVWSNTEPQPQTQDTSMSMMDLKFGDGKKDLLPPLEQLMFREHNLLPVPTSEQLHQDS